MIALETKPAANTDRSAAKAWLRALELTAQIPRNRERILPTVIQECAERWGNAPALLSDRECFTFRELAGRSNQYARWAIAQGIEKGDVVALLMANRPEYFAIWLGITSVGGVVALLNTNLSGASLAHCVNVVRPKHVVLSSEFAGAFNTALPDLAISPAIWAHDADFCANPRIDLEIRRQSGERLEKCDLPQLSIEDRALQIFTSGTTGLPKAAYVSHARVLQWSYWFAGMMGMQPEDRMYSCLPMYHSIGGVLVPGATLVGGGSLVVREKFSARQFWSDVVRWDCTMFQYIGEFCRYLLHCAPAEQELNHRIRVACGNGLAPDVWEKFQERFGIPQILEFYASTEGGVSLFNAEGKKGAIGRIPAYLTHRFSPALVQFDVETGRPIRNAEGFCIPCAPNQTGEALGKVMSDASSVGSRFEGYTDEKASENKIMRGVFAPGDAWVRTGDLMRKDEKGFFHFVDRVGDTFRWKGENVATLEVAETICSYSGVKHANVYGVTIPGTEGRAGMAAIVAAPELDLAALRRHLADSLPSYARPVFLRIREEVELTGTFKYSKAELASQGFNPGVTTDPIYFNHPESHTLRPLDLDLYEQIQKGEILL